MFSELTIDNFKCFSKPFSFNLEKVNLFTGYNGRGKSTCFQAFLLLAQTLYDGRNFKELLVNGIFCKLGLFQDLLNTKGRGKAVHFSLKTDNKEEFKSLELSYVELTDRLGRLSEIKVDGKSFVEKREALSGSEISKKSSLGFYPVGIHKLFDDFQFVAADRLGPTLFEEKNDLYVHNPIGNNGEFKLNVLAGNDELKKELATSISRIMDGGVMDISGDQEKTNEVLKLYFSTIGDSKKQIKAINSGFGYSYVIPILLSALTMKGGCLFIENPEAHLHPCAQSKLMKELIRITLKNNTQLFVETHSEHIVNAMRLCMLYTDKEYEDLTSNDVSVYFFDKNMDIKKLSVEPDGQMPEWPKGFFDQAERDAAEILRLGLLKQ
jgi:predicted ATPase